jgi:NAD(P)-dependent dehydrogenase (short-subunit alcohol dehydrogenase family)
MTDHTARGAAGKTACIVGAGGGIGRATVTRLAREGFGRLILMDRAGACRGLEGEGRHLVDLDLAEPATVAAAFAAARRIAPGLDALVVLSGVVDNGKLAALTLARWSEIIAINLTGPFLCCREAREWLVDGGRIVLTGSLAGRTGGVLTGTAYVASKAGIEGLTKSVANELAPRRITVNAVAPGIIDTPMLDAHPPERRDAMGQAAPLRRLGRPEEVAAAIAYLLSDDAAYVTGTTLAVNGGFRMD